MKNTIMKIMVAAALLLGLSSYAEAQPGRRFYIDAGWQFNGVVGNDFATGGSGWGAYAEGAYGPP